MTGVNAATLRAWERRYGFPAPERTSSAYRLYSERDIEMINRLRELCDGGMAPAQAAKLVLQEEERGAAPPAPGSEEADPFGLARDKIVEAVEDFDPFDLDDAVRAAMFLGSPETTFDRVLGPAMRLIGDRWHDGSFSVAQEHMASEILGNAIRDMLRLVQPKDRERIAILACTADEDHSLPLYGLAFRFASWGIRSLILGARTPPAAIRHANEALRPKFIALSISLIPAPHRARELFDDYAAACMDTPWIVGGAAIGKVSADVERAGGIAFGGDDLRVLRQQIETFMTSSGRSR